MMASNEILFSPLTPAAESVGATAWTVSAALASPLSGSLVDSSVFPSATLTTPSASAQKSKRFTEEQTYLLEAAFKENPSPSYFQMMEIVKAVADTEERVKSWFARKRTALKKASSGEAGEVSSTTSKRKEKEPVETEEDKRRNERLKKAKFAEECTDVDGLRSTLLSTLTELASEQDKVAAMQIELDAVKHKLAVLESKASAASAEQAKRFDTTVDHIRDEIARSLKTQLQYKGTYKFLVDIPNVTHEIFKSLLGDEHSTVKTSLDMDEEIYEDIFGYDAELRKVLMYGAVLKPVWPLKLTYSRKFSSIKVTGKYTMVK